MQLVRCEQCGAKALIAASQCPRCAHAFFLRDSRGETVPLGHCHVCDTYYPRSRGGCHWCGTKVSALPLAVPRLLLGLVGAALVVAIGVWQFRERANAGGEEQATSAASPATDAGGRAAAAGERVAYSPDAEVGTSGGDSSVAQVAGDGQVSLPARASTAATAPAGEPAVQAAVSPSSEGGATAAQRPPAVAPPGANPVPETPTRAPASGSPASGSYSGPWSRSVAQSWVNVRAAPSLDAAVVGVVTPKAVVELGEARGGWRRVRSAGVQGWADSSFFAADSSAR